MPTGPTEKDAWEDIPPALGPGEPVNLNEGASASQGASRLFLVSLMMMMICTLLIRLMLI